MLRIMLSACSICAALCCATSAPGADEPAGAFRVLTLEADWRYRLENMGGEESAEYADGAWQTIRIPHMGQELSKEPPRSTKPVWFRRHVELPNLDRDTRVLLQVIEGRRLKCWLNGKPIETPFAEASTLLVDVTALARGGDNVLAVQSILPGIQGYVRLHLVPRLHLSARGLQADLPKWAGGPARVRIRTEAENHFDSEKSAEVRARLVDDRGQTLAQVPAQSFTLATGQMKSFTLETPSISDPPLWAPETPRLCRVIVEMLQDGKVTSRQEAPFGFRWHRFEPEGAFSWNGRKYPVRGVVYTAPPGGNELDRQSLWEREVRLLKGMGVNFVRAANNIEQGFYDVCDRAGLFVTAQAEPGKFDDAMQADFENTVREYYNHPSLVAWHTNGEGKDAATAREMSRATQFLRKLDPTREVLCCELGWRAPGSVGLVDADIAGQGNYTGWYEGTLDHIGPYLDDYRALLRERYPRPLPILVSNFGAAGDAELHRESPIRNDYSHEYLTAYHARFYAEIEKRPWLCGGFVFCFRDLQTEQPIPRHTWKGMLDLKDRKKDAYYFYQSRWTTEPMVRIVQADWKSRELWPARAKRQVDVFSNVGQVELFHDGKSLGTKTEANDRFTWDVVLHEGENSLRAVAGKVSQDTKVTVRFQPPAVEPRLVVRPAKNGAAEPFLTWNEIPSVDRYLVYAGDKPDFDVASGKLVGESTGAPVSLEKQPLSQYYRVIAQAGSVKGPASFTVARQPGTLQWRFMNTGWLYSTPTIADLTGDDAPEIVVGSYNGTVYALSNDGNVVWSFKTTDPVVASPAVASLSPGAKPSVVINSTKALYVLSHDGTLVWQKTGIRQFDRSARSPSLADLDGDRRLEIVVGSDTGQVLVFDADGRERWKYSTAKPHNAGLSPTTCVVVDLPGGSAKGICFATDDGSVYVLDAQGKELWKHDTGTTDLAVGPPPNESTPAVGALYDAAPPTIVSGRGKVTALDTTGRIVWERADRKGFPQISDLFRDGNRQVVLTAGRMLHVLDSRGQDVWSYTLPHSRDFFLQPPTCADLDADGDPDLVGGTRAAKLLAISSRGELLWSFTSTDELSGTPAVADINKDGIVDVVFGSRDGALNVLSAGRVPPYSQESRTYRDNLARTAAYGSGKPSTLGPIATAADVRHHDEVAYGSDPLQKFDVYLPPSSRPTPVIIEFHGGGWRRGHKRQNALYLGLLEKALASGIAVVSANYRLTPRSIWPAQGEDAVRVVQHVRAHAREWNIDSERVVLIGGSAGAHLSLWVGLHDDLADPQNADPVRRQSTRVSGIVDCWGPTDLSRLELIGRTREALPQFFGCTPEEWETPRIQAQIRDASPLSYVSPGDPPVMIVHTDNDGVRLADDPGSKTSNAHSSLFGICLKRKLEAAGCRAEMFIESEGGRNPTWSDRVFVFIQELFK